MTEHQPHQSLEVWSLYPGDPDIFSPSEIQALHEVLRAGESIDSSSAVSLLQMEAGLQVSEADRPFFSMGFTVGGTEGEQAQLNALIEERIEKLPPGDESPNWG